MNRLISFYLFLLILLSGLLFSASAANDTAVPVTGELLRSLGLDRKYHKCIAVADGDTLTLEALGIIRFVGVDTPEKNHPKLPVQFMAKEASAFTKKMCLGKKIRLEYDPYDEDKRGNYGRVLGYLYLEDGTFLQEELLKNGYAIAYTKYPLDENKKAKFLKWEQQARHKRIGLWNNDGFPEILWILAHKHPLLQVTKASKAHWKIAFGNWVLEPVQYDYIESRLHELYSSIYEFSPRELKAKLGKFQYKEKLGHDSPANNIFVIAMAHKKWGIIYKHYALARLLPEELDKHLEQLYIWTIKYQGEALENVLHRNQYRLIPEKFIRNIEPRKIAKAFLQIYEVKKIGKNIIPWDLAGNYIGQYMFVEGKIVRTHNSGKACFLNFHNNWTRYFGLVIFDNVFHRFPEKPEGFYLDKFVRVKGKIKMFNGRPEIVLNRPEQIKVIAVPEIGN
jgi:micrococcal nuclease